MLRTAMQKPWYPAIALAIGLLCSLAALADKPVKPPRAPTHEFVPLFAGAGESSAFDVNDSGLIVGRAEGPLGMVAGYWDASAASPTFTALPGNCRVASGVNENGAIVGESTDGSGCYWSGAYATPVALPPLPGHTNALGYNVGLDDVVVGISYDPSAHAVAWRVSEPGVFSESGVFGPVELAPGASESVALGVAVSGAQTNTVVGDARFGELQHAVVWELLLDENGGFTVTAGPTAVAPSPSHAHAISDGGDIAGEANGRAFVIRGGQLSYLAIPPRYFQYSCAWDLSDTEVVGDMDEGRTTLNPHGARWSPALENLDRLLPASGWATTHAARGVDNLGRIVGYGIASDGSYRAWLIRPL